jgi:hypothetical protein
MVAMEFENYDRYADALIVANRHAKAIVSGPVVPCGAAVKNVQGRWKIWKRLRPR